MFVQAPHEEGFASWAVNSGGEGWGKRRRLIDLPDDPGYGAVRALNPKTGDRVWEYKLHTKPWAGVEVR